jgi:acyl carrier protein
VSLSIPFLPASGLPAAGKLDKRGIQPLFRPIAMAGGPRVDAANKEAENSMDRAEVDARIRTLAEPFNKKGVAIDEDTTFAGDLEFDSLTVMDFVAAIEDEFDIIISMNQQAEIETWGNLVDAVHESQSR